MKRARGNEWVSVSAHLQSTSSGRFRHTSHAAATTREDPGSRDPSWDDRGVRACAGRSWSRCQLQGTLQQAHSTAPSRFLTWLNMHLPLRSGMHSHAHIITPIRFLTSLNIRLPLGAGMHSHALVPRQDKMMLYWSIAGNMSAELLSSCCSSCSMHCWLGQTARQGCIG